MKQDDLLRTEMLVQEGVDIHELPIIIKRTNDVKSILEEQKNITSLTNACLGCIRVSEAPKPADSNVLFPDKQMINNNSTANLLASDLEFLKSLEVGQMFEEIESSASTKEKSSDLESVIHTEINSRVALQSLRKIIDLERKHRKLKRPAKFISNRHTHITQLIKFIASSQDSEIILEALSVLLRDNFYPPNNVYKDILTNETLIRSANGNFSIQQLISAIRILSIFRHSKYQQEIDYFWAGILIKQEDIAAEHLLPLFKLLIHMKHSRNVIQSLLEKKLTQYCHKLSASQMSEILHVLKNDSPSHAVLQCVGKWANAHLMSISKYDFLEFIESISAAKCINSTIEKSMEKAVTAKSMNVNDHALMTAIAAYCSAVHLRNVRILKKIVRYVDKHAKNLPFASFVQMISAFGELNFEPQTKKSLWTYFENILDQKLLDSQPDETLCILLSCAYVNKHFPKYANKIFSSEFLDKLHSQNDIGTTEFLRDQLYLLDTAMTIECEAYSGPVLFRSTQVFSKPIDIQISQTLSEIHDQLVKLAGDKEKLSKQVTLNKLLTPKLYMLDALIHKKPKSEPILELDLTEEKNENTAVLIMLPHYYCWNSTELIGQQAMKIRHLRKMGFRVMLLDFQNLQSLHSQPDKLEKYLNHTFKTAFDAL